MSFIRKTMQGRPEYLYWPLALMAAVLAHVGDLVSHALPPPMLANLAWSVMGVVFFVRWIKSPVGYRWICLHVVLGLVATCADSHYVSDPPDVVRQLHTTMSILGVLALGCFGGRRWCLVGLAIAISVHPGPFSFPITLILHVSVGATGIVLHEALAALAQKKIELERLAFQDALTGLGNRRDAEQTFVRYQALARRNHSPLLLMVWDLDALKRINDTEGHKAGDAYITSFANALRTSLRQEEVPYRFGGDEFVSLHFSGADGERIALRVRSRFESVSVGWVVVADGESFSTALSRADRAMYADKERRGAQRRRAADPGAGAHGRLP